MNTRILMVLSALLMAILGVAGSFLPQELLFELGAPAEGLLVLVVQITGALYLAFSVLNWTARANLIGGIYSRPVALGNFLHFVMVTLALWKAVVDGQYEMAVIVGAVVYTAFAVSFGFVLFTHPRAVKQ